MDIGFDSEDSSITEAKKRKTASVWNWMIRPLSSQPTANLRREKLLAWLDISLFLLATIAFIIVQIVDPPSNPRHGEYIRLILGLELLLAVSYGFNCAGRYIVAAGLMVICAFLGPWGSMALDPTILHGDFVPLAYTTISILLSSLLLPPLVTGILGGIQLVGLALIPLLDLVTTSMNWPSFLFLVFFTTVLGILSNILIQQNLEQINQKAIVSTQNEARMREISVRDHLTNLFNRRYLEESLEREIRRSLRVSRTIGIIMFDIDHYKQINDEWGHAAGDAVLQEIAQMALGDIRGGDIACRYGGDEFVLVLPETSLEVTRARAEILREKAKGMQIEYNSQKIKRITLSMGVASFPDHGSTGSDLLKFADQALYRAKNGGRDCVAVAEKGG
jgi:diguanylate cyclase (GGDEF)-like protein